MRRFSILMLEASLLLSTVLALIMLVRIAIAQVLPIQWYWGGALTLLAAPLFLAGALFFAGRIAPAAGNAHAQG